MKFVHVHFAADWMKTIWPVTSFKLFIVHLTSLYVHGYILMTIGNVFLFWNQNFCLQIKKSQERLTVVYITEKHVHFAADWMNKFPNRGRYQIANIISWQNSLYCLQLSTSWFLTILIIKSLGSHWTNKKRLGDCLKVR
jgi:hypothetical protein